MERKSGRNCSLVMKALVFVSVAAATLFGQRSAAGQGAGGGTQKALELLRKAEAACSAKEFSKGVELTYKAATASHGAPSTHPARRKWRPQLRKCYNAWINDISRACKADPATLDRMKELTRIAKQARKVAEAAVARKALARRKACFLGLAGKLKKHCTQDPGAGSVRLARGLVKLISSMGKTIPAMTATRMTAALPFCLDQWLKSAITRCQAMPGVTVLRELGSLVAASTPQTRPAVRKAYEACAKQMGNYAWQLCQRRQYRAGRALLKEAIGRYSFFKSEDLSFLTRMKKTFLPRCGTFHASMAVKIKALTAGVTLNILAGVEIVLARGASPGRLEGILRVKPKLLYARSRAGLVLARLTGGHVFLKGKYNAKSGNLVWWPYGPPTPGVESIQVNRRGRAAVVFRDSIVDDLLKKTGLFKSWMSARTGATKAFRYKGSMGGGRRGTVNGTLTMGRLK